MKSSHKSHFSLVEIIVVTIIFAVVSALVVKKLYNSGTGEARRDMVEKLNQAFVNSSVRARGFNQRIDLVWQCDALPIKIQIKTAKQQSTFDQFIEENQSEEDVEKAQSIERNQRTWGGATEYDFHESVTFSEANIELNDEGQLIYSFFPDGEASGPDTTLMIEDEEYQILVDRLTGQLNIRELTE